jgi:hypothetical protein
MPMLLYSDLFYETLAPNSCAGSSNQDRQDPQPVPLELRTESSFIPSNMYTSLSDEIEINDKWKTLPSIFYH